VQGVLNEGLLHSALEMPKACFSGKDLHRTIYDKTAAYLFHMIQNHPFVDGNKRTASMTALVFLSANFKGEFRLCDYEYQDVILRTAQGLATKKELAQFFRKMKIRNT
jgi:death-on-curing protein